MSTSHSLGTLSNREILDAIETKLIDIFPFDIRNLGSNSYDVALGDWYYREQNPVTLSPVYNIYSQRSIERVWGAAPQQAVLYKTLVQQRLLAPQMENFKDDDQVIMLAPGETILAHTNEFIGGRTQGYHAVTTKMHARSSVGRSLLGVCKCAGLGDAGYVNRWTMEITSFAKYHWIPLVVGRRIAQIEFQYLASIGETTAYSGKYQFSSDLEELKKSWVPMMMLPRLYLDRELTANADKVG